MELAGQVCFGLLGLIVFVFVAGFVDAWWGKRKRGKKTKKGVGGFEPPTP